MKYAVILAYANMFSTTKFKIIIPDQCQISNPSLNFVNFRIWLIVLSPLNFGAARPLPSSSSLSTTTYGRCGCSCKVAASYDGHTGVWSLGDAAKIPEHYAANVEENMGRALRGD